MMNKLDIVPVGATELLKLQQISQQTFIETFGADNNESDMQTYLTQNLSLAALSAELNCAHSKFYFAKWQGQIVGYLKLNFGSLQNQPTADVLEIERIYLLQAVQGRHFGQQLLNHAIAQARAARLSTLWLGVWEHNQKAIHFYQKNGFERCGEHIFQLGGDPQIDWLMRRKID